MTPPPDLAALARLKQIASQATSGPWGANLDHPHGYCRVLQMDGVPIAVLDHLNPQNDTVHMAAFDPSTVLALIAHIEDQAAKLTLSRTAGRAEVLEEVRRLIKGEFYGAPDGRDSAPDHVRQVVDWVLLRIDDVALRKDVGQACAAGMLVAARIADSCGETRAAQGREAGAGVSESDHFAAAGALKAFATHLRALASDPAPGDQPCEHPVNDRERVIKDRRYTGDDRCGVCGKIGPTESFEDDDAPIEPNAVMRQAAVLHASLVPAPAHPTEPGEVERLARAMEPVLWANIDLWSKAEPDSAQEFTARKARESALGRASRGIAALSPDATREIERLRAALQVIANDDFPRYANDRLIVKITRERALAALSTPIPAQPKGETE